MIEKKKKKECLICHKKRLIKVGHDECKECRLKITEEELLADQIQMETLKRFTRKRFIGGGVDPNTNYKQPYREGR